jgi:hypothetical protein
MHLDRCGNDTTPPAKLMRPQMQTPAVLSSDVLVVVELCCHWSQARMSSIMEASAAQRSPQLRPFPRPVT